MGLSTITQAFADMATDFEIIQPKTTYTGTPIQPIHRGLPKITQSLCPECSKLIEAVLSEEDGKVIMEKTCPEHGDFSDVIYSDAKLYLKMEQWSFGDNRGLYNPAVTDAKTCPTDCGLCTMHTSHTGLANVDLTNRCNLTCPVCFANANTAGYLYEPGFEHVRKMLTALRERAASLGPHRPVLRRRADHLPLFPGRRAPGQGTRLLATSRSPPTACCSPTSNSPSAAKEAGSTPSTSSSTASPTTSTCGRAASRSSKRSCSASRTPARPA